MFTQFNKKSHELWQNLSTQIAIKFSANQLNTEETRPLLQAFNAPQTPNARASQNKQTDPRTIPLNRTELKTSWINTCLEAYRREGEHARYHNTSREPTPPQRPQALLDISGYKRDPNHYLFSAVVINNRETPSSTLDRKQNVLTDVRSLREKPPANFTISLIWAIPDDNENRNDKEKGFSTQIIRYAIPTDDHDKTNTLNVIHYDKRAEHAPLTSEDLRTLHDAMPHIKKQNTRVKIYSPEHPKDIATLNAYHTLRKLIDDAKKTNEKFTMHYLLSTVECHLAYRKSGLKGEQFDTLRQYALVLNTLYQDALQAHTLIDS